MLRVVRIDVKRHRKYVVSSGGEVSNRGRIDSDSDREEEIRYRNLEGLSQAHPFSAVGAVPEAQMN
jgi:hypothetical protein